VIEPIKVMEEYGADALRFYMLGMHTARPFMPPFLRRNEILVEIDPASMDR